MKLIPDEKKEFEILEQMEKKFQNGKIF